MISSLALGDYGADLASGMMVFKSSHVVAQLQHTRYRRRKFDDAWCAAVGLHMIGFGFLFYYLVI